jgi:predicted RNA-binding protein
VQDSGTRIFPEKGAFMCEADAYLIKDGMKRVIMESVDIMKPEGEDIYLENIFGERLQIKARIKEMNLVDHCILLVEK